MCERVCIYFFCLPKETNFPGYKYMYIFLLCTGCKGLFIYMHMDYFICAASKFRNLLNLPWKIAEIKSTNRIRNIFNGKFNFSPCKCNENKVIKAGRWVDGSFGIAAPTSSRVCSFNMAFDGDFRHTLYSIRIRAKQFLLKARRTENIVSFPFFLPARHLHKSKFDGSARNVCEQLKRYIIRFGILPSKMDTFLS